MSKESRGTNNLPLLQNTKGLNLRSNLNFQSKKFVQVIAKITRGFRARQNIQSPLFDFWLVWWCLPT